MYTVTKTVGKGIRFPEDALFRDYKEFHYSDMISYAALNAMKGHPVIEIGDSKIAVKIACKKDVIGTPKAMDMLKEYGNDFADIIMEAIPKMSEKYQEFYQFFLTDRTLTGGAFPIVKQSKNPLSL